MTKHAMQSDIEEAYDKASRSPSTGKLYAPSQRWGGTLHMPTGSTCTIGSPLYNTKAGTIAKAIENVEKYKGSAFIFSRKQSGCKLVCHVWWDSTLHQIQRIDY
jgi:hypothetical protein